MTYPGLIGGFLVILLTTFALVFVSGLFFLILAIAAFGPNPVADELHAFQAGLIAGGTSINLTGVFAMTIVFYLAAISAIWMVSRFGTRLPVATRVAWLNWHGDRQFWWLTLLVAPIYGLVSGWILGQFEPQLANALPLPHTMIGAAVSFALIVVIGPISEEMLFRGWLYTGLRTRMAFQPAAFLTAALFAIAHYERTHTYALVILPLGLLLAYVRERYGSIKASTVMHLCFNLFGWAITYAGLA